MIDSLLSGSPPTKKRKRIALDSPSEHRTPTVKKSKSSNVRDDASISPATTRIKPRTQKNAEAGPSKQKKLETFLTPVRISSRVSKPTPKKAAIIESSQKKITSLFIHADDDSDSDSDGTPPPYLTMSSQNGSEKRKRIVKKGKDTHKQAFTPKTKTPIKHLGAIELTSESDDIYSPQIPMEKKKKSRPGVVKAIPVSITNIIDLCSDEDQPSVHITVKGKGKDELSSASKVKATPAVRSQSRERTPHFTEHTPNLDTTFLFGDELSSDNIEQDNEVKGEDARGETIEENVIGSDILETSSQVVLDEKTSVNNSPPPHDTSPPPPEQSLVDLQALYKSAMEELVPRSSSLKLAGSRQPKIVSSAAFAPSKFKFAFSVPFVSRSNSSTSNSTSNVNESFGDSGNSTSTLLSTPHLQTPMYFSRTTSLSRKEYRKRKLKQSQRGMEGPKVLTRVKTDAANKSPSDITEVNDSESKLKIGPSEAVARTLSRRTSAHSDSDSVSSGPPSVLPGPNYLPIPGVNVDQRDTGSQKVFKMILGIMKAGGYLSVGSEKVRELPSSSPSTRVSMSPSISMTTSHTEMPGSSTLSKETLVLGPLHVEPVIRSVPFHPEPKPGKEVSISSSILDFDLSSPDLDLSVFLGIVKAEKASNELSGYDDSLDGLELSYPEDD